MSEIGSLLRKLRGKESLREASKRIGISHTYLDTIEKGFDKRSGKQINPSPDTLRLIADAYNYLYINVLKVAGYIDEANYEEEFQAFIKDPSLMCLYRELPKSKDEELQKCGKMCEIIKSEESK